MILNMECRDAMSRLPDCSVDAIVTDPPYGLSKQPDMVEVLRHWLAGDDYKASGGGFMGKSWDSFVPGPSVWKEAIRCLKPGAWAVVFAGSRTQDLMGLSLRLAGFEIMDAGMWLYASGFPKSMDIGKAIDKAAGAEREVVGVAGRSGSSRSCMAGDFAGGEYMATAPHHRSRQAMGWLGYRTQARIRAVHLGPQATRRHLR